VNYLDNKVVDNVDALCNHEDSHMSALCSDYFTLREKLPFGQCVGGWMYPRPCWLRSGRSTSQFLSEKSEMG